MKNFIPSRRSFLAATAAGSVAAAVATARAASFGNPDEPPEGAVNAQGNPASVSDPGPHDPTLQNEFPGAFSPAGNRCRRPTAVLGVLQQRTAAHPEWRLGTPGHT